MKCGCKTGEEKAEGKKHCTSKGQHSLKDGSGTVCDKVRHSVDKNPSKWTGELAKELEVSELEIMRCLAEKMCQEVSKDKFDDIIAEISQWGKLTVLVQNESTILEVKASFPVGSYGHGYYNLKSKDTPIGGHIRISELAAIFFVSKPFMKMETHSIQFFNNNGNAMFRLYLGRDEKRVIIPEQIDKFLALKEKM